MITYYLDCDLVTGDNNGLSPANAWQSWAACKDYLNANHADLITAEQRIDVLVSGSETLGVSVLFAIDSNSTYFVKFVAATPDPGVWGGTAPQVAVQAPSFGNTTPDRAFRCDRAGASGGYYYEFEGINFYYPMMYSGSLTRGFFNQNATHTANTSFIIFRNCFVKFEPHTGTGIKYFFQRATGNSFQLYNCIFEGMRRESGTAIVALCNTTSSASSVAAAAGPVVNCTFIDCGGFIRGHASADFGGVVANCLFVNSPAQIENFSGTFMREAVIGSNASTTLQTMQGNDNQTEVSVTFVSGTDRKLTAANDWGAGPKHGVYGPYVPATDVVGTARLGFVTDVGAHQSGTRTDTYDYTYGDGPSVEYYLHPGLESGNATGHSEADAFRSWFGYRDKLNADHPNLVTSMQTIKAWLLGTTYPQSVTTTFASRCSETYPLVFEVPMALRSPGVFDLARPGIDFQAGSVVFSDPVSVGIHIIGLQMTGPTNVGFRIDTLTSGSAFALFRDNYAKDRFNGTTSDLAAILNTGNDNMPGTLISHNNIFENFTDAGLGGKCQVYRWPSPTVTFKTSNDIFINIPERIIQSNSSSSMSWINGIFLDADTDFPGGRVTYSTSALSGYNVSNRAQGSFTLDPPLQELPGTVGNLYEVDIEGDLFVSPTNRNLKASNGYGIGPANADTTRAELVAPFDAAGVERTGTTTDVGAFLFVAEGPPPTPGLITPTATAITETTATIGCTLDSADGTLWAVVTDYLGEPTAAQIKAGLDGQGNVAAWAGSNASLVLGANTFNATGLIEGTQYYTYFIQNNGTVDSNILAGSFQTQAAAGLPAVLDTATTVNIGQTSAVLRVSSDTNTGTLHWFLSTSATPPSAANLKAGTGSEQYGDATPPALGVNSFALTGLTPATTYHSYFIQETVDGDSNIVTASFQTATDVEPPPPPPPPDDLIGLLQVWTGTAWFPINP